VQRNSPNPITPSLITPQGAGSGLDADTLDGQHASNLLSRANHTGTQSAATIAGTFAPGTISPQGHSSGLDADTVDGKHASELLTRANHTGTQAPSTISPQGSGSGLDADTVDGLHAHQLQNISYVCASATEGEAVSASCPSGKVFRVVSAYPRVSLKMSAYGG
jgi:hypothetical protein